MSLDGAGVERQAREHETMDTPNMSNAGIDRIIDERDEWRERCNAAIAERAHYGDMMSAALGQCENERDAARAQLASVIEDYQSRLVDAFSDTGKAVMERDAAREELAIARKVMDKVADQRDAARAEAVELREKLETVMRYVNGANELHVAKLGE